MLWNFLKQITVTSKRHRSNQTWQKKLQALFILQGNYLFFYFFNAASIILYPSSKMLILVMFKIRINDVVVK